MYHVFLTPAPWKCHEIRNPNQEWTKNYDIYIYALCVILCRSYGKTSCTFPKAYRNWYELIYGRFFIIWHFITDNDIKLSQTFLPVWENDLSKQSTFAVASQRTRTLRRRTTKLRRTKSHPCGYSNKQNALFWEYWELNPLHPRRVTVWYQKWEHWVLCSSMALPLLVFTSVY